MKKSSIELYSYSIFSAFGYFVCLFSYHFYFLCIQELGLFQMTCVRLLEMFPVVFERLSSKAFKLSGTSDTSIPLFLDFKWLHDLVDWGKSSLVVLSRHWKQCVLSLLNILKVSCHVNSARIIMDIETLISCGEVFLLFFFYNFAFQFLLVIASVLVYLSISDG